MDQPLEAIPADDWVSGPGTADLVSVVIPTHNRRALLQETLESFLRQTYGPIELIVVGDGVLDTTAEMVAELELPSGCRLEYLEQAPAGAPAARNRGARHARGEFLLFMDDDDVVAEDFLAARVSALQASGADLAHGPWQRFTVSGAGDYQLFKEKGAVPPGESAWASFLRGWELLLQGCLLRRGLVQTVGPWDQQLLKSQDLDYKVRLLATDCQTIGCTEGFVYYRSHPDSISGERSRAKLRSYVEVLTSIESIALGREDYGRTRELLADYLLRHAFWLYSRGGFDLGRVELARAKRHAVDVCRRHSKLAAVCDRLGLAGMLGPTYHYMVKLKMALGLSKILPVETRQALIGSVGEPPGGVA